MAAKNFRSAFNGFQYESKKELLEEAINAIIDELESE